MSDEKDTSWFWKIIIATITGGVFIMFGNFIVQTNGNIKDTRTELSLAINDVKMSIPQMVKDQITLTIKDELLSIHQKMSVVEEKQSTFRDEQKSLNDKLSELKEIASLKEKISSLEKQWSSLIEKDKEITVELQELREKITKLETSKSIHE